MINIMKCCFDFRLQYSISLMNSLKSILGFHTIIMTLVSLEKVTVLLVSETNPLNPILV